jgi:hypothetical protein
MEPGMLPAPPEPIQKANLPMSNILTIPRLYFSPCKYTALMRMKSFSRGLFAIYLGLAGIIASVSLWIIDQHQHAKLLTLWGSDPLWGRQDELPLIALLIISALISMVGLVLVVSAYRKKQN